MLSFSPQDKHYKPLVVINPLSFAKYVSMKNYYNLSIFLSSELYIFSPFGSIDYNLNNSLAFFDTFSSRGLIKSYSSFNLSSKSLLYFLN